MSYLFNNEQKMNEIIFANRNKSYGAYEIRSSYGNTVFRALSYVSIGFGTLFGIAFYLTRPETKNPEVSSQLLISKIYEIPVNLDKKEPEPQKKATAAASTVDKKNETTRALIIDSVASVNSATIGAVTATIELLGKIGIPGGDGNTASTLTTSGNGTTEIKTKSTKNAYEVDELPEFEGGLRALKEYLGRNTHYPVDAIEEGRGGTLHVRFIVNEQGFVTGAELLNKLDDDLNHEALRVVNSIPKFKSPGKVNGEPVSTYYQVPIRFVLK